MAWWGAILGVIISTCASGCSAFANVLLKVSHNHNLSLPEEQQRPPWRRCHYYAILSLYILNGLLDTAAFALAPMSLLAPTSTLTIVINGFTAYFLLGENMSRTAFVASFIIIVGAVVCTVFGSKESDQRTASELRALYSREPFMVFVFIDLIVLAACAVVALVAAPSFFATADAEAEHEVNQRKEAAEKEKGAVENGSADPSMVPSGVSVPLVTVTVAQDGEAAASSEDIDVGNMVQCGECVGDRKQSEPPPLVPKGRISPGVVQGEEAAEAEANPKANPNPPEPTTVSAIVDDEDEEDWQQILAFEMSDRRREKSVFFFGLWAVCMAVLLAGVGTWTNILLKSAVEMLSATIGGDNQLGDGYFWLFVGGLASCAITQLFLTQKMMCTFPAVFIIPIFQCVFTISLIVGGGMYFDEFKDMSDLEISLFGVGCAICFFGIGLITSQDKEAEGPASPEKARASSTIGGEAASASEEAPTVAVEGGSSSAII